MAIKRVKIRVEEGGHNIPENVIIRRYENVLKNFFGIFKPLVDSWTFVDNSGGDYQIVTDKIGSSEKIVNDKVWNFLKTKYHGSK